MRTIAVLPVKRFADAKQRLAERLREGTRRALTEAMLSDVLTALRRCAAIDEVLVVSSEPSAHALALAHGAVAIDEPATPGHNAAAMHGVAWALEHGAGRALLVPGDCPLLAPRELDELLAGGIDAPTVTIVPDRHGDGTNALVLCPPDAIAPSFGAGSRERHERAGVDAGATTSVVATPTLLLDIDTPDDLDALAQRLASSTGAAAHTRGLLVRLTNL